MTELPRTRHPRATTVCCIVISAVAGCGVPAGRNPTADNGDPAGDPPDSMLAALPFVEDELLVQPFPGADPASLATVYDANNATVIDTLDDIDVTVLRVAREFLTEAEAGLIASGLMETVQKNFLYEAEATPSDPLYSGQSHLPQINAPAAWDLTTGDDGTTIAVVDTGVDAGHSDLAGKIVGGWNAFDGGGDYSDVLGHGTQVAGVAAAASNNAKGVAGVTWNCPVLAVRGTDVNGRASARHLAAGVLWSAGHGAKVINLSFAPLWSDRIVRAAAQEARNRGALVVIAAGNAGGINSAPGYGEAVFVGALDGANQIATFSDRGPFVDLAAPGINIRSTQRGGTYGYATGTSFAAPVVAGVAALMWSANPDLRPVTIEAILESTALDLGALGKDDAFGHGAVDAGAAVAEAAATAFEPDHTPPTVRVSRPSNDATLIGRSTVSVTASDQWGVADVVMSVDGVAHATDTRAPFDFVLDTAAYASGSHRLSFVATDLSGNASSPVSVTVTFRSSLSTDASRTQIRFTSPTDGATVSGDVTIQASVSDSDGLATLEWLVDGESKLVGALSGRSSGLSYRWRTSGVPAGRHIVTLVMIDLLGNRTAADLELITR